ncbi:MAG: tRNA pseudouridine(55) synthase TruB [Clostridia bacterium]|nr:tRNA pseudouridine(55) synthase TruB [Clostridia bacterium]
MNGFVILDKPSGPSSFQAAGFLRRVYNEKKAGHTGTLDPMAGGVLPVALGRATRLIEFLPEKNKAYRARLRFGLTTDTLDITGKVLTQTDCAVTAGELCAVLPAFRGEILQTPPMFSAVSVNGQRLYTLARQGKEVERQRRTVTVYSLELTGETPDGEFELSVSCSAGTYIRTLIDDIGRKLGCGAVMTALRRTAANGFTEKQAFTREAIEADPMAALLPADAPFAAVPAVYVSSAQATRFQNGGALFTARLQHVGAPGLYRVYAPDGRFLGLGGMEAHAPEELRVRRVYDNGENGE